MNSAAPPGPLGSPMRTEAAEEARDERSTVGKSDLQEETKKEAPSWVSVAQDKKVLKKYVVEVSSKDGLHTVEIPDDVLTTSTPLWEDFVVGKFLDVSPHVAKVHMVLNKIWKYGDTSTKVDVIEVNATTMRFKVSNPKAREKIMRRGMWNIAGVPMVVTKWSPRSEEEKQEEEAIPMWVHLHRVPLHMFSWEGLSFITSAVGFPVKLHPGTIACTNFEEAKLFAKVDVSKPLPKEINFSRNGKEFKVEFQFPWLPMRCKKCDKWGYDTEACKNKGKDVSPPIEVAGGEEVKALRIEENWELNKKENTVHESLEKADEERNIAEVETQEEVEMVRSKGNESNEDSNWARVSPTKIGRSLVGSPLSNQNDEICISASKFEVLSVDEDEEEGEIMDGEAQITYGSSVREVVEKELTVTLLAREGTDEKEGLKQMQTKVKEVKEKKAKSQEINHVAMSTRSSRRQH